MQPVETLLTRALVVCKTAYQLSKLTGEPQSTLSSMRKGKRPVPPALVGQLAAIVGEDPKAATLMAIVSQAKDPTRRAELAKMYGLDLPQPATISAQGPDGLSYVYSKT